MAERSQPSIADFVVIAISPALIVAMIASLVYFLVALLYRGEFGERLHHILFFLTFGLVLVARVSMERAIADRAPAYGAVLAFLAWIGLNQFVAYADDLQKSRFLIHAGLVALIWWLAHRITYSCTYIDEKAEATGFGVLHAAGLERTPSEGVGEADDERMPWNERYRRFRDERKTKNTPGIWVIYFGLAALPIFGLGQSLIDVEDVGRRTWTFALMVVYVASSLGLLATTAFLGLRRYLRQRRTSMPASVTSAWLASGAVMLVAFVTLAALIPRPRSELSLFNLPRLESKKQAPSRWAFERTDGAKDKGAAGDKDDSKRTPGRDGQDDTGSGKNGRDRADKGGAGAKDKGGSDGKGKGEAAKGNDERKDGSETKDGGENKRPDSRKGDAENESDRGSAQQTPAPPEVLKQLQQLAAKLKWIVFGLLVVGSVLVLLRGGLGYLAHFLGWAKRLLDALKNWWSRLFGPNEAEEPKETPRAAAKRKFFAYSNPFHDGRAEGMLPGDLVRYSFEALERWSDLWELPRKPEETPQEFGERVKRKLKEAPAETENLADLFARVLYARGPLPPSWKDAIECFWDQLDAAPRP